MKSNFTVPKTVIPEDPSQPWLIYFRFEGKAVRKKYGLNYIKDIKKREKEADLICEALHERLKDNWNPFAPDEDIQESAHELTLAEALDFALEKKTPNISKKSLSGYTGTVNFCKTAIEELKLTALVVSEVKRAHIKGILEKISSTRKWSNNAYNKNLGYLQAVLSELIQWDIIETNPAHNIKCLSVSESRSNIPATDEQTEIIKKELSVKHPYFYTFIIALFHTGIRPAELLKIRLHMVDLNKQEIILPPEITKTDIERIVPINGHLLEYFIKMEINAFPKNYFLFGSFRESGRGNVGKHRDFIPGPTELKRDTATKRWKKIVKDGLGIDANMYSMKHLGANKKILAGMDLDSLRELYGHTSKLMTEKYAKVIKEVHRKQIMEKSPDF